MVSEFLRKIWNKHKDIQKTYGLHIVIILLLLALIYTRVTFLYDISTYTQKFEYAYCYNLLYGSGEQNITFFPIPLPEHNKTFINDSIPNPFNITDK